MNTIFLSAGLFCLANANNIPAWPMYRNNIDKSGKSVNVTAQIDNSTLLFFVPSDSHGTTSSPVIGTANDGSDLIYFIDQCGAILAYGTSTLSNQTNPAPYLWKYETADGCEQTFSPSISHDGSILMAATTKTVYSFNATSGKLLWFYEDPTSILFNGSPLILEKYEIAFVATIDDSTDGSCYVYGFDLGTGDIKKSYCFSDPTCPATELTFSYGYEDNVMWTGCNLDGSEPVIYRGHLDDNGADSFLGFGIDHNGPVIFVPDTSGDDVHDVVFQLSNGVLGGILTITGDQSNLCKLETDYFQTMALVTLQPKTRPDLNPPMIVTIDVIHNLALFVTPTPNPASTPLPANTPCLFNYSVNLNTLAPLSSLVIPTVDAIGNVFFPDQGGNVYVIEGPYYTGIKLIYSANSSQPIFSNIVIGGQGRLYFTDFNGNIYGVGNP